MKKTNENKVQNGYASLNGRTSFALSVRPSVRLYQEKEVK